MEFAIAAGLSGDEAMLRARGGSMAGSVGCGRATVSSTSAMQITAIRA
jgi:hypothetical protein